MDLQKDNPNTQYFAAKDLKGQRKGCVAHHRRESKRESSIDLSASVQSVYNTVPSEQCCFIPTDLPLFCTGELPGTSTREVSVLGTRHHHPS